MSRPKTYTLGSRPEIILAVTDDEGLVVLPTLARLSVEEPDGTVFTVSGGVMTSNGTYLSYVYDPQQVGWYEYEGWVRDSAGRESASQNGFTVIDRVP
jgi:hypothetical protein